MNSYASFCSGDCTGSAEIVIRDHDGVVLVAAARWLDDVPDALTAEALATKEGLELAAELGYQRVVRRATAKACGRCSGILPVEDQLSEGHVSTSQSLVGSLMSLELSGFVGELSQWWLMCVQLELLLLIAFLSGLSLYQSGCVILQCVILQRKIVILLVINEKLCSPKKKSIAVRHNSA